mmetsp:Transcript_17368/g.40090  ORF Transcript_17368/g.40090 Transcript_17368/m.40090 type:complete len:600 (+) Transcript_17368:208-2007(+)
MHTRAADGRGRRRGAGERAWGVAVRTRPVWGSAGAFGRVTGRELASPVVASRRFVGTPRRKPAQTPLRAPQDDWLLLKNKLKKMAKVNLNQSEEQVRKASGGMMNGESGAFALKNLIDRPEKPWRPVVMILLAQMLQGTDKDGAVHHLEKSEYLAMAEIVEVMHISTLIHDTVLEEGDSFEKGNAAHRMYSSSNAGNKVSILAGDALLSRASVLSASLRNNDVVELVAGALESLMVGQMQMYRPTTDQPPLNAYVNNVVLRSGDLVSKGCEASAVLAGYPLDHPRTVAAREFGLNLAIAYQMLTDLRVTEANYDKLLTKMAEEAKADSSAGAKGGAGASLTDEHNMALSRAGPLLYASVIFPELEEVATTGLETVSDALHARSLIERCDGVEGIRRLAEYHARLALDALDSFAADEGPGREAEQALRMLVHYVVEEGQARLLRANYDNGVFVERGGAAGGAAETSFGRAKQDMYSRLDKLYGQAVGSAWQGVEYAKELVFSTVRGARDRARYDVGQLHRGLVRDAVLLYGKNVGVEDVHRYIHGQCAFRASAKEVEAMLVSEIKWQIANGVETAADLEAMRQQARKGDDERLVPERVSS